MINLFPLHDETPAPEAARDALAATNANFGMIPNLERVMAEDLALLAAKRCLGPVRHHLAHPYRAAGGLPTP